MKNLQEKIAVITGAGSGMGRSVALLLASKGATVLITDKDKNTLAETAELLENKNYNYKTYVVNAGNEKQVFDFAKKVIDEFEYIDILVNNAGYALGKISLQELKMEDFKSIMDVNLWGVINHTKAFLDVLISRPEASIVNTSSIFGIIGVNYQVPYCTTKFAVRGFSEALRMELADTGVCVTVVHPGGIKTNIVKNSVNYDEKSKASAEKLEKMFRTTADDAAKVIVKAIQNKQVRLLIGMDAVFVDNMYRTLPTAYTKIVKKFSESNM